MAKPTTTHKPKVCKPMDQVLQKSSDGNPSSPPPPPSPSPPPSRPPPLSPPEAAETSLDKAMQATLRPIHELLKEIQTRVSGGAIPEARGSCAFETADDSPSAGEYSSSGNEVIVQSISDHFERIEEHLAEFRKEVLSDLEQVSAAVSAQAELKVEDVDDLSEVSWERIFLGERLCEIPALALMRDQFLQDVVDDVDAARSFAAQMMLVQSATVEEMPELFKHVGEAYYRWHPRTSTEEDPFEKAVTTWLTRQAEAAGLRNSIQLVRPGERFESSRHLANGRGVEIVAVHGWVVLRDGNKVYTRANVSVK